MDLFGAKAAAEKLKLRFEAVQADIAATAQFAKDTGDKLIQLAVGLSGIGPSLTNLGFDEVLGYVKSLPGVDLDDLLTDLKDLENEMEAAEGQADSAHDSCEEAESELDDVESSISSARGKCECAASECSDAVNSIRDANRNLSKLLARVTEIVAERDALAESDSPDENKPGGENPEASEPTGS